MTRKTLVSPLILALCAIVLIKPETADSDYIQQGKEKFSMGDYAGAIADFESAVQRAPESPAAYYYRATAKFEQGKFEQGTGNVQKAKRLYHAAVEDYTQVITLDPEIPDAYIFGGTVHLRLADLERTVGNSQQAKHHFQEVHKMGHQLTDLDPGNVSGWRTRGVANHRLGILAADRGDREQAQRHYEDGIEAYTQAIAFGPTNPSAYATRGAVHSSLGLLEMVRGAVYSSLGLLEMDRDRIKQAQFHYTSAIADQEQAVRLSPPEYTAFFSTDLNLARVRLGVSEVALGNIQAAQHQYRSAIEGFDEVIGMDLIGTDLGERLGAIAPTDVFTAIAYNSRAEAQLRFGESETLTGNVLQAEQHYREAIADCDQVLTLGFQQVEAFYTRGRAKAALADYTGAISDFGSAITIKSDHALAYYARGLAKEARGVYDTGDDIALDLEELADLIEQNVGEILEQDITVEIEPGEHLVPEQDAPAEADFRKAKALNSDVEKLYPFSDGVE